MKTLKEDSITYFVVKVVKLMFDYCSFNAQ